MDVYLHVGTDVGLLIRMLSSTEETHKQNTPASSNDVLSVRVCAQGKEGGYKRIDLMSSIFKVAGESTASTVQTSTF